MNCQTRVYTFGLKRGVGLDTMSEFFTRLHLATQVGPYGIRANCIQLAHDGGSARSMNGPIHSTSAVQTRVGRIHDGIDTDFGDIPDY